MGWCQVLPEEGKRAIPRQDRALPVVHGGPGVVKERVVRIVVMRLHPAAGGALNWERIRGDNPHVKYHSARRGYVLLTATARELRAEFKVLDKVTVPGLPDRTGASLVVEAGRPGLVAG